MKVQMRPTADLVPYENNPRDNDAAVMRMINLIEKFGFKQPILVRGTRVVDGHLRLKAALKMNYDEVPTIDVGQMPEAEEKALRIAMNKSVEWANWDMDLLAKEMLDIKDAGIELEFTGFSDMERDKIFRDMEKEAKKGEAQINKTMVADGGMVADPNYVSVTFHMTAASRTKVQKYLDKLMKEHSLANRSQALIFVANGMKHLT